MDILIIIICLAFITILASFGIQYFKENITAQLKQKQLKNQADVDTLLKYQRKIREQENEIKRIQLEYSANRLELEQTKGREKNIKEEKSRINLDFNQYEKLKKECSVLKQALDQKEEMLENEITMRRTQSAELAKYKQDQEILAQKLINLEDFSRKSKIIIDNMTKELDHAKKTIASQKKIVQEHTENKLGGEWVSRLEFEKLEKVLKEKENILQKFLSIKKSGVDNEQ